MLHVVYHPGYIAPAPPGGRFRFDKYGLVMDVLRDSGAAFTLHESEPMPRAWIERVHTPAYVNEVLTQTVPREKERRIGFPVTAHVAQRSLLSAGGTWLAARLALAHGHAANSAGGSHHAAADSGAGYCVFNDLAIAANRLIAEGDAHRILILDLDVHQGDGTATLTAERDDIFTLSLHAERNFPVRKSASTSDVALPDGLDDAGYMRALAAALPDVLESFAPDLILYQAGVDPHLEDRLGRLALTDAGLVMRDGYVRDQAHTRRIPFASTLGGGYGDDRLAVARRHVASMLTLAGSSFGTETKMHSSIETLT
jgi:acetoin utilization deacetylase AcuC-like enzyme